MRALLTVDFCGERHEVVEGAEFTLGREADLSVDDNAFLHRHFLRLSHDGRLWWIANIGSHLSATVTDAAGGVEAYLPPGGSLPVVFPTTTVRFTAGSTTYEVDLELADAAPFTPVATVDAAGGETTVGPPLLTTKMRVVVVALAEPTLRGLDRGPGAVPSSADAAARAGVPLTTFNRRLDHICDKLDEAGVRGLHGDASTLAANRRARLVEYAVATRLVTAADLVLLDPATPD